jgi:hypothetical protein
MQTCSRKTWMWSVVLGAAISAGSGAATESKPGAGAGSATPAATASQKATPRLADGRPDLNGTWDNGYASFIRPQKSADGSVCIMCPPPPGPNAPSIPLELLMPDRPKYKKEFEAKVRDLNDRQVETDPALRCKNPGLPRIGPPDKIVHVPGQVVFLYDDLSGSFFRIIPTDGRPHRNDVEASYLGDAVGKWDGDVLVIETANFIADDKWLSDDGTFHTAGLQVTERLHRVGDQIEYNAVADDPAVLAEPWQLRKRMLVPASAELVEPPPCIEDSLSHVVDGTHHDNPR